jgi:hypothetical protein
MFYALVGIGVGFTQLYSGESLVGVITIVVCAFGFFGLMTLWSLARHYWTQPTHNPTGAGLRRNLVGLIMGVTALISIWGAAATSSDAMISAVAMAGLFTIPVTLFFLGVIAVNWATARKANNALERTRDG